jgi:short-subunit dehydrogenase
MNINKVAITGHTRGIGASLTQKLSSECNVLGFSRSNGYDISKDEDLIRIIDETLDCEVFVNNAYHFAIRFPLLNSINSPLPTCVILLSNKFGSEL